MLGVPHWLLVVLAGGWVLLRWRGRRFSLSPEGREQG
jgi:hypothetical protein